MGGSSSVQSFAVTSVPPGFLPAPVTLSGYEKLMKQELMEKLMETACIKWHASWTDVDEQKLAPAVVKYWETGANQYSIRKTAEAILQFIQDSPHGHYNLAESHAALHHSSSRFDTLTFTFGFRLAEAASKQSKPQPVKPSTLNLPTRYSSAASASKSGTHPSCKTVARELLHPIFILRAARCTLVLSFKYWARKARAEV